MKIDIQIKKCISYFKNGYEFAYDDSGKTVEIYNHAKNKDYLECCIQFDIFGEIIKALEYIVEATSDNTKERGTEIIYTVENYIIINNARSGDIVISEVISIETVLHKGKYRVMFFDKKYPVDKFIEAARLFCQGIYPANSKSI